jgi:hypothetical protein
MFCNTLDPIDLLLSRGGCCESTLEICDLFVWLSRSRGWVVMIACGGKLLAHLVDQMCDEVLHHIDRPRVRLGEEVGHVLDRIEVCFHLRQ